MSELRVLGDLVPDVKAALEAFWATDLVGARVTDELPGNWRLQTDPPVVAVTDDGGPVTWPLWARTTLRVTVYAYGKQTAKQYRAKSLAAVLDQPPPGVSFPTGSPANGGIGYTEGRDPQTGADIASFTIAATVCTQTVTV